MGQNWFWTGLNFLFQLFGYQTKPTAFQGEASEGSLTMTNLSTTAGLQPGMYVVGDIFYPQTYIVSINPAAKTLTLSQFPNKGTAFPGETYYAVGNAFAGFNLYVHLCQGVVPTSPGLTFAAVNEANYDGYVPQQLGANPVIASPQPKQFAAIQYPPLTFEAVDFVVPNVITGHVITFSPDNQSTPVLIASETYLSSVPMQQPGDLVSINPTLSLPYDATQGISSCLFS